MTAIHQQRRDNVKRIVELLLSIYDSSPVKQRSLFEGFVRSTARYCSLNEQRDWITRLEIIADDVAQQVKEER